MKNSAFYYSVGALLYCPANKENLAQSVISEKFGQKYSLALCLEDTIADPQVLMAEEKLCLTLAEIAAALGSKSFYLPKIFIRIRNAEQMTSLFAKLGTLSELICGFILPKFSMENADSYLASFCDINSTGNKAYYIMPIYESDTLIDLRYRNDVLYGLKEKLSTVEPCVLNLRVGGNDLCHSFGFRRHVNESIHSIRPVSNIFADIITAYGRDYVISGPVWEYFGGDSWESGLRQEISEDLLMGFVGKTVIHPNQIAVVNDALKVSREDFEAAKSILDWDPNADTLVSQDVNVKRMNEYKTHTNWAEKILFMADYYGVVSSV